MVVGNANDGQVFMGGNIMAKVVEKVVDVNKVLSTRLDFVANVEKQILK